jgi:hypothetical protein
MTFPIITALVDRSLYQSNSQSTDLFIYTGFTALITLYIWSHIILATLYTLESISYKGHIWYKIFFPILKFLPILLLMFLASATLFSVKTYERLLFGSILQFVVCDAIFLYLLFLIYKVRVSSEGVQGSLSQNRSEPNINDKVINRRKLFFKILLILIIIQFIFGLVWRVFFRNI